MIRMCTRSGSQTSPLVGLSFERGRTRTRSDGGKGGGRGRTTGAETG